MRKLLTQRALTYSFSVVNRHENYPDDIQRRSAGSS